MYRLCKVLQRTSRRSRGGWTPVSSLITPDQVPVQSFGPPPPPPPQSSSPSSQSSSRNAQGAAGKVNYYDDADNARTHVEEVTDPYFHNWRANPALRPSGVRSGSPGDARAMAGDLGTGSLRKSFVYDDASARRKMGLGSSEPPRKDEPRTLTNYLRWLAQDTFERRPADSVELGGSGRTDRLRRQQELKYTDQRMRLMSASTLAERTIESVLRSIEQIEGPSGALYDGELLRGRLVGLLFFTDGPRSREFMIKLQKFHVRHTPDFVVVAVSACEKELVHLTRGFGFYHCRARYGGTMLMQGTNGAAPPFVPLPRLIIVEGGSGEVITRGGVTAVSLHPETCFAAWRAQEPGFYWTDWIKMCFM